MATTCNMFNVGEHATKLRNITASDEVPPPKPLLIAHPMEGGEYPVLILLHGFLLNNTFYSQLLQHVASHGFIAVAPQLHNITGLDTEEEIKSVALITDWLTVGLDKNLPDIIIPNLSKLAISGHSRGGKVAYALALDHARTKLKYSALIGIDPVEGQTTPRILTGIPDSLKTQMPTLVIGSGLGGIKKNALFPPCAPIGVSHQAFFDETCEPKWHFVAKEYGHMDMLDDETGGFTGSSCKNGKCRMPMRDFVGGIVVAFFNGYLNGDMKDLVAIEVGLVDAPVELAASFSWIGSSSRL